MKNTQPANVELTPELFDPIPTTDESLRFGDYAQFAASGRVKFAEIVKNRREEFPGLSDRIVRYVTTNRGDRQANPPDFEMSEADRGYWEFRLAALLVKPIRQNVRDPYEEEIISSLETWILDAVLGKERG